MDCVNIVSLNVRGLHDITKRNAIYSWFKEKKCHICYIQETYCTESNDVQFRKGWSGNLYHSFSDSTHSRGVAIMLSKNFNGNVISSHSDHHGRLILLNIEINEQVYTLVNVYTPNDIHERIVFFRQIMCFINAHAINKSKLIIAGDFNYALSENDRVSGKTDRSTNVLIDIMVSLNVVDIWRLMNPNVKSFTYVHPTFSMRNSRIDLLLFSDPLKSKCLQSEISQTPAPDHKAISITLQIADNKRGKGYWKLNNSYLEHDEYQAGIVRIYDEIIAEYNQQVSISTLWDYFKLKVKQFSITQ